MKTPLNLSIPKPCSEKWQNFTTTVNGGFCASCNKTVIDFTGMSDDEIFTFLNSRPTRACGRFRPHQLKAYSHRDPVKINPGFTLLKAGLLSLLFLLLNRQASAQTTDPKVRTEIVRDLNIPAEENNTSDPNHRLKGLVKDEYGEAIPGASIVLKGTVWGTSTDVDGRFEFPIKVSEGDVLIFSFIGYETEEYKVPKKNEIGIDIMMELELDVSILGELLVDGQYHQDKGGLRGLWSKVKALF